MKKTLIYLTALVAVLFISCKGDTGPMGPPGQDGDGGGVIGQTFEYDQVHFEYESDNNLWATVVDVPDDIEVLESDAILVFRIESQGDLETYSLLPQTFFTDQGILTYVYNHTAADVELLIDGDYDLQNLDPIFTDDQVFRFVVIPSDFANDPDVHIQNYSDLIEYGVDLKEAQL